MLAPLLVTAASHAAVVGLMSGATSMTLIYAGLGIMAVKMQDQTKHAKHLKSLVVEPQYRKIL